MKQPPRACTTRWCYYRDLFQYVLDYWEAIVQIKELLNLVVTAAQRGINWILLRCQIQAVYKVLNIMAIAINHIQKDGVPYHRIYWEKEKMITSIRNVENLDCLSPEADKQKVICNICESINTKYNRHVNDDLISFCCVVNYRRGDGIITDDLKKRAGSYFCQCHKEFNDTLWNQILEVLKRPEVHTRYGSEEPCNFWHEFFSTYSNQLDLGNIEADEISDLFCDYSTLPSSSAYVERCFSMEKRITVTKRNISNEKVEATLRSKTYKHDWTNEKTNKYNVC